ncbi:MAG TPA: selenocysteine-specific translation elongation factor, partial [Candidatus Eisenbacteria bacterium]|nr:selenocysteine-specific translation elongation factor [Candidatus Eisenbacteria bacterium]
MTPAPPKPSGVAAPRATRLAIVGTAGHIDHGKTALVRRLTGIDTDRLPEEKKRGISIDLGFAPLVTPAGVQVGIVDVPGHERFVKNMLAGVGGVDLVLLVIAADEGVMPQTREHLAIVQLLGVTRGIVVLTKSDLVERDWLDEVTSDARALIAATPLAGSPMVEFSAITGDGQPALLAAIDAALADAPGRALDAPARLPVDRVFTMEGFGTVVTGTLWRGSVKVGDSLELLPGGFPVRVRRVQVHGVTVEEAHAGQRTALALHGVAKEQVARGDWLVAPGSLRASSVLDVRFELLPDYPRPWKVANRVRFHLGASEIIGRLTLLEGTTLAAGKSALAQIALEKPAVPARGDRFVIRAY